MKVFYSEQVSNELRQLENSQSPTDNQRARIIRSGIQSAIANPLNTDNIPAGEEVSGFFVQKAGGQIRIFYTTDTFESIGRYLFLTWVNPEEFPHDTNNGQDNDPCYNEFKRLNRTQRIERFQLREYKDDFKRSTRWGSEFIQFILKRQLNGEITSKASSTAMRESKQGYYLLSSISVDDEEVSVELLNKIIEEEDGRNYSLAFEIYLNWAPSRIEKHQRILRKCGFILSLSDGEIELWELLR